MKKTSGFTLIEMLIALAILTVILGIAFTAIIQGLQVQGSQEAATSSQARLRRVGEVFTQELRSAVLGAISNEPYTSTDSSVSFTLLDGGAGYQVLPHDSGKNSSFVNANNVQILAPASSKSELGLEGGQALMVNASGQAIIFTIDTVSERGSGSGEWNLVHPKCANKIDYTLSTLLFKVKNIGLSYDADTRTVYQREGNGAALPLAFDMSGLGIEYVYEEADGTPHVLNAPLKDGGNPARRSTIGGEAVELVRLQVLMSSDARAVSGDIERTYLSQVELASNPSFQIQSVLPCS